MKIKAVLNLLSRSAIAVTTALLAANAQAIPVLQVDIDGGTYDAVAEDIVAPGPIFTVRALGTAGVDDETGGRVTSDDLLEGVWWLSIALTPPTGEPGGDFGSIVVDGATVAITADMVYGTPPVEYLGGDPTHDGADLATHSIFDTYYVQIAVNFVGGDTCATYNSAVDPGGCDTSGTGTYFDAITINATNLDAEMGLHFDLYNDMLARGNGPGSDTDVDAYIFAPFSHDGRYGDCCTKVPEPNSLALLGIGLIGIGIARRRKFLI